MDTQHTHICPRCNRTFDHRRFVYRRDWNALERIVARSLHRFFGACAPCIRKYMLDGFWGDPEAAGLRTLETSAGVIYSQARMHGDGPVPDEAPGPVVL